MHKEIEETSENTKKQCPECGAYSLIPLVYGLMSEEARIERGKKGEYAWGGCKLSLATDYCKECEKSIGGKPQKEQNSNTGSLFREI